MIIAESENLFFAVSASIDNSRKTGVRHDEPSEIQSGEDEDLPAGGGPPAADRGPSAAGTRTGGGFLPEPDYRPARHARTGRGAHHRTPSAHGDVSAPDAFQDAGIRENAQHPYLSAGQPGQSRLQFHGTENCAGAPEASYPSASPRNGRAGTGNRQNRFRMHGHFCNRQPERAVARFPEEPRNSRCRNRRQSVSRRLFQCEL